MSAGANSYKNMPNTPPPLAPAINLDQQFWDTCYLSDTTGWDMGMVSPPLRRLFDGITPAKRQTMRVLIPGCGNAHEAEYLINNGFGNVTLIDISPTLVDRLREKFAGYTEKMTIIHADFFAYQPSHLYDLIVEQTFFCAINPLSRKAYIEKMHQLLASEGKLAGLLFDRIFDKPGPPFGGFRADYVELFQTLFAIDILSPCPDSHVARQGTELFFTFSKK